MLSDIEMARKADTLKPQDIEDDLTKSGLRIQPYPSDFYPATAKKIKCYLEVYDLDKAESDSALLSYKIIKLPTFEVLNEWGMVERIKPISKSSHYKEIDINDLPSGHYRLQLALISSKGKILSLKDKSIFRSNPTSDEAQSTTELAPKISTVGTFVDSIKGRNIKQYLYHLGAIASKAESGTINTLVASTDYALMRSFYLEFWNRRNKVQAYEMHTDYRALVKEAYRKYGQKSKPLLESDRARVYLRFGEPNQILTEQTDLSSNGNLVYEIWQYYSLERTGQTGVDFVFVRESSSSQYVLVHSTATGERRNDNWRSSSRIR
jgi:GWxTD domain-containing protein